MIPYILSRITSSCKDLTNSSKEKYIRRPHFTILYRILQYFFGETVKANACTTGIANIFGLECVKTIFHRRKWMGLQAGPVHCHQRGVGGRQDGEHEAHPSVSREVATPTVHICTFFSGGCNKLDKIFLDWFLFQIFNHWSYIWSNNVANLCGKINC